MNMIGRSLIKVFFHKCLIYLYIVIYVYIYHRLLSFFQSCLCFGFCKINHFR
ncbi:unnamed protein product, partial [Arabidopsis halleri]